MSHTTKATNEMFFLICENVREEVGNKKTIVGIYPNDEIGVPTKAPVGHIGSLTIIGIGKNISGDYEISFKIYAPSGEVIHTGPKSKISVPDAMKSYFNLQFNNFAIKEFGIYELELSLGKKKYSYEFKIFSTVE